MCRRLVGIVLGALAISLSLACLTPAEPQTVQPQVRSQVYAVSQQAELPRIRLIALKHSHISMADGDANLAISAVNKAASAGLPIKAIGNFNIDKNGLVNWDVWPATYAYDLPKLKEFISQKMKVDALPGDTVIVFTIGHGFPSGSIQNLGPRADVMKAIADAAEENQQRTLWWQLSCHASAGLPSITSLPPAQQRLFSVLASSTAQEQSAAGVQGRIMEKVFMAIAQKDSRIDPNGDGIITAQELRDFLNGAAGNRRGDLLYVANMSDPIFGGNVCQAREIPILDRSGPQGTYPKEYIPLPGGR